MNLKAVVFDIGEVLVDWNPRYLYRKVFTQPDGSPDEARVEWFLENICTREWNIAQDAGRPFTDAVQTLEAEWRETAMLWHDRFQETIAGHVPESVAALRHFRSLGLPVHGLTNFSAETFPGTLERFDFLQELDGIVVSGEVKMVKPDPAIFHHLTERFALTPPETLFIDDSKPNVDAASALGFEVHHFKDGPALLADLASQGYPVPVGA